MCSALSHSLHAAWWPAAAQRAAAAASHAQQLLHSRTSVAPYSTGGAEQQPQPARDQMDYDLCIVGAGPAGLSAAIRFKQVRVVAGLDDRHPSQSQLQLQHCSPPRTCCRCSRHHHHTLTTQQKQPNQKPQLCAENGRDHSVCVIEKGSEVGAHVISGNVFQPTAFDELFPDWRDKRGEGGDCEGVPLRVEAKKDRFYWLGGGRAWWLPNPRQMKNKGNYVISLRWVFGWFDSFGCLLTVFGWVVLGWVKQCLQRRHKRGFTPLMNEFTPKQISQ